MTFLRIFTTTSALALAAGPALAELTADQVWTDWKDLLESYGAEVSSGGENQSGGALTVSDLVAAFSIEDGSMTMELGDLTFTEQGDGSVVVTMQDTLPVVMDVTDSDGKTGRVGFNLSQTGGKLIASGDTSNLRYDFDYPTLTMSDLTIEGDDVPEDMPMTLDFAMTALTGFVTLTDGDVRSYDSVSNVGTLSLNMDIDDPDEGKGRIVMSMTDIAQTATGTLASIEMDMSAAEMVRSGLTQNGTGTYGPSTMEFAFDGPDGALEMAAAAEGGTLDISLDENGIDYGGVTNGITMTVGGAQIPFPPLTFAMEKSEGRFKMPFIPDPERPQDFGLVMSMEGLEIDNMLWNMFDPAEQLPREPATLVVDLGGSVILTEDFTNPEYAENMDAAPPGTIETLDINAIRLKLAGAELTGDGAFAFNNDTGMPMPSGTANLMLTGGNTLLDTLVGMGLVPEDQAMGARMMLGLFARPGDGPDTLVSTIEVNEDGSVLANGQRIK